MPSPFEAMLLGLAAWRVWHLIAKDDITERLRRYVTDDGEREALDEFLSCPFCLGAHIAFAWVIAFALWSEGTMWAALAFAVASVPPLVNHWQTDGSSDR